MLDEDVWFQVISRPKSIKEHVVHFGAARELAFPEKLPIRASHQSEEKEFLGGDYVITIGQFHFGVMANDFKDDWIRIENIGEKSQGKQQSMSLGDRLNRIEEKLNELRSAVDAVVAEIRSESDIRAAERAAEK